MGPMTGVLGIFASVGLAWALSENHRRFPLRLVIVGTLLQLAMGFVLLRMPGAVAVVDVFATLVNGVITRADAGAVFLFGPHLTDASGPWGFVFAFRVLPVIIFFASLMAVLYHIGVMQRIVAALAWLLRRTLGVTGAESLSIASDVFVGQTEAPLCIRPYLPHLTRAQLATVMVGGFATIAGSVMAAYVGILGGSDPELRTEFIKHLLTASLMAAPAAFVMARLIVPETETPMDERVVCSPVEYEATNVLDAASHGATEGLKLAANVAAMLVAFVALLALIDWPLEALSRVDTVQNWLNARGIETLRLQTILGWIFMPLAWTMGVPLADAPEVGALLGEKLILTEFVAYNSLGQMIHADAGPVISMRSAVIASYALCGFANFASIAIQIGGMTVLAPSRRRDVVSLSLRAMLAGALATCMTASIAGLLIAT